MRFFSRFDNFYTGDFFACLVDPHKARSAGLTAIKPPVAWHHSQIPSSIAPRIGVDTSYICAGKRVVREFPYSNRQGVSSSERSCQCKKKRLRNDPG
jgi:hypothetical protein